MLILKKRRYNKLLVNIELRDFQLRIDSTEDRVMYIVQKPYPYFYISEDLRVIDIFFSPKDRQITQQTSRRPVQNSNIGVAGNSNFEDDDDFFNNVDMPEDVPLQRVAPKSGSF